MSRRKAVPLEPNPARLHILEDTSRAGEVVRIYPPPCKDATCVEHPSLTECLKEDGTIVQRYVEPGVYVITADVHNTRSGSRWVELVGGPSGYRSHRQVTPDRLRLANKGERARAPKVAEPKPTGDTILVPTRQETYYDRAITERQEEL